MSQENAIKSFLDHFDIPLNSFSVRVGLKNAQVVFIFFCLFASLLLLCNFFRHTLQVSLEIYICCVLSLEKEDQIRLSTVEEMNLNYSWLLSSPQEFLCNCWPPVGPRGPLVWEAVPRVGLWQPVISSTDRAKTDHPPPPPGNLLEFQ